MQVQFVGLANAGFLRGRNCTWKPDHEVLNDQGYKVSSATSLVVLCSHEGSLKRSVLLSNHLFFLQGHSSNVLNRDPHSTVSFHKCSLKTHICLGATLKWRKDAQWNITHTKATLITSKEHFKTKFFSIGFCAYIQFWFITALEEGKVMDSCAGQHRLGLVCRCEDDTVQPSLGLWVSAKHAFLRF